MKVKPDASLGYRHLILAMGSVLSVVHLPAHASFETLIDSFSTELERKSARAVLATYKDLIANAGCFDTMTGPTGGAATGAPQANAGCTGQTYELFRNVRRLIHTGNELTKDGSTLFSLGVDARKLGFALRWNAAEEYSAHGSLSSDFLRGQTSSLTARLSALRQASTSLTSSSLYSDTDQYALSDSFGQNGGGAGDDSAWSPWGGFINYAVSDGDKLATDLEDAFKFDGSQINAGFDYRFNERWTAGALVSRIEQRVDFDSSKSVVSGYIDTRGISFFPFAMYQRDEYYINVSAGLQQVDFDSLRAIRYLSLNPNVPSPDTQALAATQANTSSLFLGAGYTFVWNKVSLEPYMHLQFSAIKLDAFTEKDIKNEAFNLAVSEQKISSRTANLGASLRYVYTPSFAVITPYTSAELVFQHDDKGRSIGAHYANAFSQQDTFGVPVDAIDSNYQVFTLGLSAVLMGAQQAALDGAAAGGLQGFVQYKSLQGLKNYSIDVLELGLRYEF